ncbi:KxYKxGKxW signal peptide domain-containing protein [Ligilactobacillus ceti]|uniref:Uncharacterized protein n=1 Tax=Ligilactobacillus ceti DSM 22408 TaxID=1122146 RepID=A0A0R2KG94_9LACO|nr:KxYKxGKxW signal peptide domain-containing protein [Ligilactobacillus ceti]KRN88299.1 hypothetical protein IV53_GL001062 [Ligilactobacillus ceti DSM 22408]
MKKIDESKQHYRMYKSGKNWLFSTITTIMLASGLGVFTNSLTVNADQIEQVNDKKQIILEKDNTNRLTSQDLQESKEVVLKDNDQDTLDMDKMAVDYAKGIVTALLTDKVSDATTAIFDYNETLKQKYQQKIVTLETRIKGKIAKATSLYDVKNIENDIATKFNDLITSAQDEFKSSEQLKEERKVAIEKINKAVKLEQQKLNKISNLSDKSKYEKGLEEEQQKAQKEIENLEDIQTIQQTVLAYEKRFAEIVRRAELSGVESLERLKGLIAEQMLKLRNEMLGHLNVKLTDLTEAEISTYKNTVENYYQHHY